MEINYIFPLKLLDKKLQSIILDNKLQTTEWINLGFIKEDEFKFYENLPVDTKFFDDTIKQAIEGQEIRGILWKGDNKVILNQIKNEFNNNIQTIFVDPPYNLGKKSYTLYNTSYKDEEWYSMLKEIVVILKELLKDSGSIFVKCNSNGNYLVRILLNEVFGKDNFRNEIITNSGLSFYKSIPTKKKFRPVVEYIEFYSKSSNNKFNNIWVKQDRKLYPYGLPSEKGKLSCDDVEKIVLNGKEFLIKSRRNFYTQSQMEEMYNNGNIVEKNGKLFFVVETKLVKNNWTDIEGLYTYKGFYASTSEQVLYRVISSTTDEDDWVLDCFLGSGTTSAVAMKLKRKFIGIEIGDWFDTIVIPRIKKVIFGEKKGISKEVNWSGGGGVIKYIQ